jgi:hypothetical protein
MQASQIPPPSPTPENPLSPAPTEPQPPRRSRKKLGIAVALVAVVAVALVAVVFLANPTFFAMGETVPLTFSYSEGEKMTYSMTMTMDLMGQETTETGTSTVEILSVQGDTYTIRTTTDTESSPSVSYTMTMDKTGRITDYGSLPENVQQSLGSLSFLPGYGSSFPKQEAKVGESWQIPLDTEVSGVSLEGAVNCKVSEVKSLTVPAGTYNVFKMEISINNAHASSSALGANIEMTMNANGYVYLEKGTGRTIELLFEETVSGTSTGATVSVDLEMQMQLTEHIR